MASNEKEILAVEAVEESIATWANQPFISEQTRQSILKSNLLIVPTIGFRSLDAPVFPVCTEELFQFLKERAPAGVIPEICIEDKDYKELALHGALLIVGAFVVTTLAAPVVADLIGEYIKRRFFKQAADETKTDVRVEITVVEESGKATRFTFEGPAKDFRKTLNAAMKASTKEVADKNVRLLPPSNDPKRD